MSDNGERIISADHGLNQTSKLFWRFLYVAVTSSPFLSLQRFHCAFWRDRRCGERSNRAASGAEIRVPRPQSRLSRTVRLFIRSSEIPSAISELSQKARRLSMRRKRRSARRGSPILLVLSARIFRKRQMSASLRARRSQMFGPIAPTSTRNSPTSKITPTRWWLLSQKKKARRMVSRRRLPQSAKTARDATKLIK